VPTCIVMQGVPGSGKTTIAEERWPAFRRCSADDHFVVDGEYRFDPAELPLAHQASFEKFLAAIEDRADVVVDNTNTSVWKLAPYFRYAEVTGYDVRIVRVVCDPEIAAARNSHGVPAHAVKRMAENIEASASQLPPWWPVETVDTSA
jgi:predicted kinase